MEVEKPNSLWIPALPDLFELTEDGIHLVSSKCNSCNTYFFPHYHEQHRPECSRENVQKVKLARVGTLASYAIQHYMPPPPFKTKGDITPYIVGLVDFPEGIQVAGIVIQCSPDQLELAKQMETTTFVLYQDDNEQDVVTWAFKPLNS
jgi:uncharacterized OB-fold protein